MLSFLKNPVIEWNVHFCRAYIGMKVCFRQKVHLFLLEKYHSNLKIYNMHYICANNTHHLKETKQVNV